MAKTETVRACASFSTYKNIPLRLEILVFASNDVLVHNLAVRFGKLFRPKLESQLGNFAGKVERHLVVVVIHWRAGVHANVESLVQG